MYGLITTLSAVATQFDSNRGTAKAAAGAVMRFKEPSYYDAVFPFIAMGLVIVLPSMIALWVIYRTVTESTKEADEV